MLSRREGNPYLVHKMEADTVACLILTNLYRRVMLYWITIYEYQTFSPFMSWFIWCILLVLGLGLDILLESDLGPILVLCHVSVGRQV